MASLSLRFQATIRNSASRVLKIWATACPHSGRLNQSLTSIRAAMAAATAILLTAIHSLAWLAQAGVAWHSARTARPTNAPHAAGINSPIRLLITAPSWAAALLAHQLAPLLQGKALVLMTVSTTTFFTPAPTSTVLPVLLITQPRLMVKLA